MQSFIIKSPSMDGALPEAMISQGKNIYSIDFLHRPSQVFKFSWIPIVRFIKFNHKYMHSHRRFNMFNISKCTKNRGKIIFSRKYNFVKFVYSNRHLYCCEITDCSRVPPEKAAHKKLIKTLKNHSF